MSCTKFLLCQTGKYEHLKFFLKVNKMTNVNPVITNAPITPKFQNKVIRQ